MQAAKQEGSVAVVMGGGSTAIRIPYADAFKKAYGINIETVGAKSAEISAKIITERRAGLCFWDVNVGGTRTPLVSLKPAGALDPMEPALILPDVTDPEVFKKVWYQGKLWWVDKDRTELCTLMFPFPPLAINTNLVKPEEIKSYNDFLNPKWKGKLGFNEPTVAGYGSMCVQTIVNVMSEQYTKDLAAMKPAIVRDQRLLVDWLAHGKIAMAIAPRVDTLVEVMQAGAPIKPIIPKEGTWLGPGGGGMTWFKNAAHPNATKVFINAFTTKEGQDIVAPAGGYHSLRADSTTTHLLPGLAREEGAKYFPAYTEENALKQGVTDKIARDLFGPLIGK